MAQKPRGCLPFMLGMILLAVWLGGGGEDPPGLNAPQFQPVDPRSPRRPMPVDGETFLIEEPGLPQDSQGTAFAIDRDGVWLTAEHVTHGCDRIGLANSGYIDLVSGTVESREADVALIAQGPSVSAALTVSEVAPDAGDYGYHMGFPAGVPTVVVSRFIGGAAAQRGPSAMRRQPIYAWAEEYRLPGSDGPLGGISGGPTLDAEGQVIGVNSASTPRRGRVLTTDPRAVMRLVTASRSVDEPAAGAKLAGPQDALQLFRALTRAEIVRVVYCDVS